jgi:hydroxyacylglutathione hydrolase
MNLSTILKRIKVSAIPLFNDNYCYLLQDISSPSNVALIDPAYPTANRRLRKAVHYTDISPTTILVTHHHPDHAGDVLRVSEEFPDLKIYAADGNY